MKFKIFSSLRRTETHVRHAQGHQRASASLGYIKNNQNTFTTEYEVEHQKTFNTKLGKQTIWVSEVIKEFYHHFQEKSYLTQKDKKQSRIAFLKLFNENCKILWLKTTSIFNEQNKIPFKLNIEKNRSSQKE